MSRKSWEVDKFKDAINFIRSELKKGRGDSKSALFNKFNYPACYDIIFLKTIADEFDIDLSLVLSKKRPLLKDVLTCLIEKLVL